MFSWKSSRLKRLGLFCFWTFWLSSWTNQWARYRMWTAYKLSWLLLTSSWLGTCADQGDDVILLQNLQTEDLSEDISSAITDLAVSNTSCKLLGKKLVEFTQFVFFWGGGGLYLYSILLLNVIINYSGSSYCTYQWPCVSLPAFLTQNSTQEMVFARPSETFWIRPRGRRWQWWLGDFLDSSPKQPAVLLCGKEPALCLFVFFAKSAVWT